MTSHRPRTRSRVRGIAALAVGLALVAGCTTGTDDEPTPGPSGSGRTMGTSGAGAAAPPVSTSPAAPPPGLLAARVAAPAAAAVVLPASSAETAALEASRAVFVGAPVVVLAAASDSVGQLTGASAAVAIGAPELLTGTGAQPALAAELARLHTSAVVVVGGASTAAVPTSARLVHVASGADGAALTAATGVAYGTRRVVAAAAAADAVTGLAGGTTTVLVAAGARTPNPEPSSSVPSPPSPTSGLALAGSSGQTSGPPGSSASPSPTSPAPDVLPPTARPEPAPGCAAVVGVGVRPVAALATLRAAGLPVLDAPAGDPRATSTSVAAFAAARPTHVVALGAAFGDPARLAQRSRTAATGVLAPGGGQLVFPDLPGQPGKRYVALYGTPGSKALGVLGEQGVPQTVARAQRTAAKYRPLTHDKVVPAVELIATIASSGKGKDGDYSRERSVAELRPLVEAAGAKGLAVVLDLQPGRADFLAQAKRYQSLLELPYVSLALDPEWRLGPHQKPLHQIGSVDVSEVNRVIAWLADLTAARALPQKMLVVHEFSLTMVRHRERLDTTRDTVAVVIHVDGQGSQPAKAGTWHAIRAGAPDVHWGWKNFVDEDHPMLTPKKTYRVDPVPDLVTYQ